MLDHQTCITRIKMAEFLFLTYNFYAFVYYDCIFSRYVNN